MEVARERTSRECHTLETIICSCFAQRPLLGIRHMGMIKNLADEERDQENEAGFRKAVEEEIRCADCGEYIHEPEISTRYCLEHWPDRRAR